MTAYCERRLERLPDRPYCARPEYHRGPHADANGRTNPRPLPPCAIRSHHTRDAHKTYCRPAIDAARSADA